MGGSLLRQGLRVRVCGLGLRPCGFIMRVNKSSVVYSGGSSISPPPPPPRSSGAPRGLPPTVGFRV